MQKQGSYVNEPEEISVTPYSLVSSFCKLLGLDLKILKEGCGIVNGGGNNICGFCRTLMSSCDAREKCENTYKNVIANVMRSGQPPYIKCHAGLGIFLFDIRVGNSVQTAICGPMILQGNEKYFLEELKKKAKIFGLSYDRLYLESKKLEHFNAAKLESAQHVLSALHKLSGIEENDALEKEELNKIKSLIKNGVTICDDEIDKVVNKHDKYNIYFAYKELLAVIKIGDQEKIKMHISQALAIISEQYYITPLSFKIRVIEWVLRISREIAALGVNFHTLTEIDGSFVVDAFECNDIENLQSCVLKVFNKYSGLLTEKTNVYKYDYIVQHAVKYINTHYQGTLSIEEIAQRIHVSPYYLCHTFKEIMDCSIKQYIIRIKMEKAKMFMLNIDMNMEEICEKIGYKNNRHFAQTFRNVVGCTPQQYRKKNLWA